MIIKKMSFVFIVFAFAIMGTVISPVSAEIASGKATKEAERIARRENMIAELKAEYAAKKAEVANIIAENKVEATEITAKKITEAEPEPIATEKISDVKDAVESVSEHGAEEAEVANIIAENKVEATEIAAKKITEAEPIATEEISDVKDTVESVSEHGAEEAKSGTD